MQSTRLLASLALLTAAISTPLLAGDHQHHRKHDRQPATDMRRTDGHNQGMQAVAHTATSGAPGYGWRYFSSPAASRALVISPQGDYYYSSGTGLRWIATVQS